MDAKETTRTILVIDYVPHEVAPIGADGMASIIDYLMFCKGITAVRDVGYDFRVERAAHDLRSRLDEFLKHRGYEEENGTVHEER